MDGEAEEKVIAMHVNRLKTGPREGPDGTSASETDRSEQQVMRDRGGDRQEADPPPAAQTDSGNSGGGPECFDPESSDYKAFGWAGNKTVPALIIILKDGSSPVINYCDLASAFPGGSMFLASAPGCMGNVIRLLVAGVRGVFMIVIEGVRLWRVWELIMGHKTPWIREMPGGMGFGGDCDPVIRSISFVKQHELAAAAG
jgi:hypothetical protein